jgi:hypothetical protein
MRKLSSGLALVLVMVFLLSSAVMADEEKNKPTILIEEMRHDMGEVFERDTYRHVFQVKNIGKAELTIESVKPG